MSQERNINKASTSNILAACHQPEDSESNSTTVPNNFTSSNSNNTTTEDDPVKREETPFSLKHFLKRDTNSGATARSMQPDYGQKLTGARPKIPMHIGVDNAKMKRSPKFLSFDSQASLAEFSSASSSTSLPNANDTSTLTSACQSSSYDLQQSSPLYQHNDTAGGGAHFQRSFSTYEMGGGRRPNNNHSATVNPQHHFSMLSAAPHSPKTIISPEMSSALPDFVQDHILVENLYHTMVLNGTSSMQMPDFTINPQSNVSTSVSTEGNIPFDLMCTSADNLRRNPLILPLDLAPSSETTSEHHHHALRSPRISSSNNIPLDLTARSDNSFMNMHRADQDSRNSRITDGGVAGLNANDSFKRLPDFLSDGHVHSSASVRNTPDVNLDTLPLDEAVTSTYQDTRTLNRLQSNSLRQENARLRQELELSQETIVEQQQRICDLETKLEHRHSTISNTSDNLAKSATAMASSDGDQSSVIEDLQRQIQLLMEQGEALRQENAILKEEGAVGGTLMSQGQQPTCIVPPQFAVRTQELSRDMMQAATTAETNLRLLLNNVDNLRSMAKVMESMGNMGLTIASPLSMTSSSPASLHGTEELLYASDGDYDDFCRPPPAL